MREKEKQFIAKMIEKQAIVSQTLYNRMKEIGEEISQEIDKGYALDEILDYMRVPPDNTLEFSDSHPDVFCRDAYYDQMYDIKSFEDALKFLNDELVFLAELIDCGGIAKWREEHEEKK